MKCVEAIGRPNGQLPLIPSTLVVFLKFGNFRRSYCNSFGISLGSSFTQSLSYDKI